MALGRHDEANSMHHVNLGGWKKLRRMPEFAHLPETPPEALGELAYRMFRKTVMLKLRRDKFETTCTSLIIYCVFLLLFALSSVGMCGEA